MAASHPSLGLGGADAGACAYRARLESSAEHANTLELSLRLFAAGAQGRSTHHPGDPWQHGRWAIGTAIPPATPPRVATRHAETTAAGGADRRSAKNAAAPLHQSRQGHPGTELRAGRFSRHAACCRSAMIPPGHPICPFKRVMEGLRVAAAAGSSTAEATARIRIIDIRVENRWTG
jgi:hypothetical protein